MDVGEQKHDAPGDVPVDAVRRELAVAVHQLWCLVWCGEFGACGWTRRLGTKTNSNTDPNNPT